jgi:hypothetical protein
MQIMKFRFRSTSRCHGGSSKKRGLKKRGLKKRGLRLKKGGLDKDHTLSIRPCTEKSHGRGAEICRRT